MSLLRLFIRVLFGRRRRRHDSLPVGEDSLPPLRLPPLQGTFSGARQSEPPAQPQAVSVQIEQVTIAVMQERRLIGKCQVVDGDTIYIGNTAIRLAGIDAPEIDHPYGVRAKLALMHLTKGQTVTAHIIEDDHHGRTVATCYLDDGRDLSAEMVKAGMAVDWAKYSGGKYRVYETPDVRRKLWRCDARQKGRMTSQV